MKTLPYQERFYAASDSLRSNAIDAHLAGDGIKVCHLALILLNHLEKLSEIELNKLSFDRVSWAFVLTCYWCHNTESLKGSLSDLLTRYTNCSEHKKNSRLELVCRTYGLLQEPLSVGEEEFLSQIFIDQVSDDKNQQILDLALLTFIIELCWFRNKTDDYWKWLCKSWIKQYKDDVIIREIKKLLSRLESQTELLYAGKEMHDLEDKGVVLMSRLFSLHQNCKHGDLRRELAIHAPHISLNDPLAYIPFFNLTHYCRVYFYNRNVQNHNSESLDNQNYQDEKDNLDNQLLALSRRRFVLSDHPLYRYLQLLEKDYDYRARLYMEGKNAHYYLQILLASTQLKELHLLRIWDLAGALWIIHEQAKILVFLANELKNSTQWSLYIDSAVRLFVISGMFPEEQLFEQLINNLNCCGDRQTEKLVDFLLQSPRVRHAKIAKLLLGIGDKIPESKLLDTILWFVEYERFLDVNLGYRQKHYLNDMPIFLEHAENFDRYSQPVISLLLERIKKRKGLLVYEQDIIRLVNRRAKKKVVIEVCDAVLQNEKIPAEAKWWALYEASSQHPDIAINWRKWLMDNKPNNKKGWQSSSHYALRLEQDFPESPINDPKLRAEAIKNIKQPDCVSNSDYLQRAWDPGLNSALCGLVTWPEKDAIEFINKASYFIDSGVAAPAEISNLLQSLAHIARNASSQKVIDKLAAYSCRLVSKKISFAEMPRHMWGVVSGISPMPIYAGVYWLACTLMDKRFDRIYPVIVEHIPCEPFLLDQHIAPVFHETMAKIVFHSPPADEISANSMATLLIAIVRNTPENRLPTLIDNLAAFLNPKKIPNASIQKSQKSKAIENLMSFWRGHLLESGKSNAAKTRAMVARALRAWQEASQKCSWLKFDRDQAAVLKHLKKDPSAQVRVNAKSKH